MCIASSLKIARIPARVFQVEFSLSGRLGIPIGNFRKGIYDHINASTSSHGHGCAVLIITPLNSLISDQTSILKKRGIEAAVLTTTITSSESCTLSPKIMHRRVKVIMKSTRNSIPAVVY